MHRQTALSLCLVVAAASARADKADVLKVTVYARSYAAQPLAWTFVVTAHHPDQGKQHFCDAVRVATLKGKPLKVQPIKRPMCPYGRKPFDQPIAGVRTPAGVTQVAVEARCSRDGWGGKKVIVDLTKNEGPNFKVVKGEALRQCIKKLVADLGKPGMRAQVAAMKKKDLLRLIGRVCQPELIEGTKSKQKECRWWSLSVLGAVGDKNAIEPILACFKDPDGTVRAVAVRACRRFLNDPRVVKAVVAQLDTGLRKHAFDTLRGNRRTRALAVKKLQEMLSSPNAGSRAFAFEKLMEIDHGASKDAAVAAIKNERNAGVLSAALEYLKACKDNRPETIEALKGLMQSKVPRTRGEAFLAIITLNPKVGYETGIQALATEKDGKAYRFILGKMFKCPARDKRLVDVCIAGLRSHDPKTRNLCGKALPYLTHHRIPYYWDATPEFRAKQAAAWEKWWDAHRATFKMPPLR